MGEDDSRIDDIPECEAKDVILEAARSLKKSDMEVLPVLKRLVVDNWLETISALEELNDSEWAEFGVPRRLASEIQSLLGVSSSSPVSTGVSPASASRASASPSSYPPSMGAVDFIYAVANSIEAPSEDVSRAIDILVHENWFDTVALLRTAALDQTLWAALELQSTLKESLRNTLINRVQLESSSMSPEVEEVVRTAVARAGRPDAYAEEVLTRLNSNKVNTLQSLSSLDAAQWGTIGLPLRLYEDIAKNAIEQKDTRRKPWFYQENTDDPRVVHSLDEVEARQLTPETFLVKVGATVGKTKEEMEPLIDIIVNQHWLDNLCAMRALPETEWLQLGGLPRRIVSAIIEGLRDPVMLQLDAVQYVPPDNLNIFPQPDLKIAVKAFEKEVPSVLFSESIKALVKLLESLLCTPFDPVKRVIKKSNVNFQKTVGKYQSGINLILSLGYIEAKTVFLLPCCYITRLMDCHAILTQIAQVHVERVAKEKKRSIQRPRSR